ncbi:hypothetical protein NDU88_004048 [Pleurodeles waltl]|uniref:Uncharacterized protein n=1 Tax=Pleurodeles waltl TaxID=8319 RepID=A0AAV7L5L3_PLEWA|nr:hypothetical protein NDU88_004048 [Pleurodeles waltl]
MVCKNGVQAHLLRTGGRQAHMKHTPLPHEAVTPAMAACQLGLSEPVPLRTSSRANLGCQLIRRFWRSARKLEGIARDITLLLSRPLGCDRVTV